MFKIESDTRRLKHDVLTRVAELAYQGKLNSETIDEIPFEILSRIHISEPTRP